MTGLNGTVDLENKPFNLAAPDNIDIYRHDATTFDDEIRQLYERYQAVESDAAALTRYFEKVADDDFKISDIKARRRSTRPFIEDVQRDCLKRFDAARSPNAILDCLQNAIKRLHAGTVPIEQLVERNLVFRPLEGYTQNRTSGAEAGSGPRSRCPSWPRYRARGHR